MNLNLIKQLNMVQWDPMNLISTTTMKFDNDFKNKFNRSKDYEGSMIKKSGAT